MKKDNTKKVFDVAKPASVKVNTPTSTDPEDQPAITPSQDKVALKVDVSEADSSDALVGTNKPEEDKDSATIVSHTAAAIMPSDDLKTELHDTSSAESEKDDEPAEEISEPATAPPLETTN